MDLSPIAKLPPDLREAMAQSEALIRIGYEILNPPLMGQDEKGKVLSPNAMRAAFDDQIAQLKAAPLNSLARWRAARDSAALAMQLSWMASEAKKKDVAAAWFGLANDYKKSSYEAARHYYKAQFEDGQKKMADLAARVPVESPLSDDRNFLETLFHVQGMRAATLDNLARMHYDYPAILQWGQAQISIHLRAQKYTEYDYKDFDFTKPENDWARKAVFQLPISIANGLESVAEAQSNLGRFEEAEKTLLQSLELRRSVPVDYVMRYPDIPLRQLGSLFKTLGDYRRAQDYYLQALKDIDDSMPARKVRREAETNAAFRELMLVETAQTRATLLNNLSLVVGNLGDYKAVEQYLNQSLSEMDAVPDSPRARPIVLWHRATALGNRGGLRIDVGEEDKGLADLEESIKLWREQGYGDRAGIALLNTASIYGARGQNDESQRRLAEARQLFALSQDNSGLMWVSQLEAVLAREAKQSDESAARAEEALTLARQVGNIDYEAMTLRTLGAARFKQNRLDEATTLLNDALKFDRTQRRAIQHGAHCILARRSAIGAKSS